MENNKIKKDINNVVNDNLKALEQLFPSAVKDGQLDIKALKEELGDFEEVGNERYELNWAGKQNAKKIVQQGIGNKTLKFVAKDSKNADTTENIYIEGDNLEVLKLLRQNYYNSIKMIYIDPPYNTGNDFVYNDTFKMDKEESDKAEGIISENNEKLQKNQKSTNRYHANWLNMMYPRLKLARDLLTDDGVIFIHIDENEVCNLQKLCYEIFNKDNEVGTIIWDKRNPKGETFGIAYQHEYILVFCKNKGEFSKGNFSKNKENATKMLKIVENLMKKYSVVTEEMRKEFKNWINKNNKDLSGGEKAYNLIDDFGNIYRLVSMAAPDKPEKRSHRPLIHPITKKECPVPEKGWRFTDETMDRLISETKIVFGKDETTQPGQKYYLKENMKESVSSVLYYGGNDKVLGGIFENPKPVNVSKKIINTLCKGDKDIILDFFSGSATTAHAVIQLNSEDNGNRKYIMVQLPETTDEKSEAFKAGYKNIAEIGKERIRRAGEKIKQEIEEYNSNLKLGEEPKKVPDIGFKVFKVDDTNIKWYDLENFNEESQYSFDDPDSLDFVLGSNDIDIVYEIMLRQNDVPLSESLEVLTDIGNRTYLYASTYLICLETEITEEMVEKLASLEPLPIKFVFRDSAFKDNISLKDETFRKLRSLIERNSGESKVSYRVEFI